MITDLRSQMLTTCASAQLCENCVYKIHTTVTYFRNMLIYFLDAALNACISFNI